MQILYLPAPPVVTIIVVYLNTDRPVETGTVACEGDFTIPGHIQTAKEIHRIMFIR
jgi:hypothetical protein